jgi:hypothetical protein
MEKLTLYQIQSYVEARGFKCGGKIEGKGIGQKCRLILYRNGQVFKVGELVQFAELPQAYEHKYRMLYDFLINSAKNELAAELNEIIQTKILI